MILIAYPYEIPVAYSQQAMSVPTQEQEHHPVISNNNGYKEPMQEQVLRYEKFAYDKYMIYLMNCRKSRQKEWGEIVKKGHSLLIIHPIAKQSKITETGIIRKDFR